jgi:hypothetical protein
LEENGLSFSSKVFDPQVKGRQIKAEVKVRRDDPVIGGVL